MLAQSDPLMSNAVSLGTIQCTAGAGPRATRLNNGVMIAFVPDAALLRVMGLATQEQSAGSDTGRALFLNTIVRSLDSWTTPLRAIPVARRPERDGRRLD